ncbi:uncharacterized protein LOC116346033 [Contarinia nasturtii]|uniref:uncharacterized protein LOC116346033 n=1 Tax=Contarinia nasturtii TaxID=265458 RepID=UPI0012D41B07|nr:uncharacterized protein LOC116346033 [Contarinia nasturtii]
MDNASYFVITIVFAILLLIFVTKKSRRQLKVERMAVKEANPNLQVLNRLVSKVKIYRKNWRPIIEPNPEADNVAEKLAEMHVIDDNAIDVEMANAAEDVCIIDENEMDVEMNLKCGTTGILIEHRL